MRAKASRLRQRLTETAEKQQRQLDIVLEARGPLIRGSFGTRARQCGKPSCRCLKGYKHRALYVSQSQKGKPRLVYIPQRSEKEVHRLIKNYRRMKVVMEKISQINLERVTAARPEKK